MMPQRALIAASKARKLQVYSCSFTNAHNGDFELYKEYLDLAVHKPPDKHLTICPRLSSSDESSRDQQVYHYGLPQLQSVTPHSDFHQASSTAGSTCLQDSH